MDVIAIDVIDVKATKDEDPTIKNPNLITRFLSILSKDNFRVINNTGKPVYIAIAADPNSLILMGASANASKDGGGFEMKKEFKKDVPIQKKCVYENHSTDINIEGSKVYVTVGCKDDKEDRYNILIESALIGSQDELTIKMKHLDNPIAFTNKF